MKYGWMLFTITFGHNFVTVKNLNENVVMSQDFISIILMFIQIIESMPNSILVSICVHCT